MQPPKPRVLKGEHNVINVTPMAVATTAGTPMVQTSQPITVAGAPMALSDIQALGATALARSTTTASKVVGAAKAGDIDELGKGLTALVSTAREYDPSRWNKGIVGVFSRAIGKKLDEKIKTIDQNVDTLVRQVDGQIGLFRRRIDDLAALYSENEQTYILLGEAAEEGRQLVEKAKLNLPDPGDGTDPFLVQRRADAESAIAYAEKRIDDLKRAQVLCQLQGPQIRQLADNSFLLIQKFDAVKTLTLPLLKQQYGLYVIQTEQKKGAAMAKQIDDETDRAIKANAAALRQNSVAINTAMSRSIVSVETLQSVQKDLVEGLAEVQQIRSDMKTRLAAEAPAIEKLSRELSQRQLTSN